MIGQSIQTEYYKQGCCSTIFRHVGWKGGRCVICFFSCWYYSYVSICVCLKLEQTGLGYCRRLNYSKMRTCKSAGLIYFKKFSFCYSSLFNFLKMQQLFPLSLSIPGSFSCFHPWLWEQRREKDSLRHSLPAASSCPPRILAGVWGTYQLRGSVTTYTQPLLLIVTLFL